ncbi:MAG TPA: hypothetical protein VI793_16605 [Anaerolineales bacterium]|nr:hypothetical protein [Anaerolineales bacterium]
MKKARTLNPDLYGPIAWGVFFVWWGALEPFKSLPESAAYGALSVGIGLILLALNAARALNGIPTRWFTTALGILALVLGGLLLAISVMRLPFELPVFAILLITFGAILLARVLQRSRAG